MRIVLFLLIFFGLSFAKQQELSPIPPSSVHYIDLEPEFCDEACLNSLLKDDLIVSFLARFDAKKIKNSELLSSYSRYMQGFFNIVQSSGNKIAVIIPQKILKSYTNIITKTLMSYAMDTNSNLVIKFIPSNDENLENLQLAINKARNEGINYFITPFTKVGVDALNQIILDNEISYIPTLHATILTNKKLNLIFGGIDYKSQVLALLSKSGDKISAFTDGSFVGNLLNSYLREQNSNIYEVSIATKDVNLKNHLGRFSQINNSSIFLNLSMVKASLIATQLKTFNIKPYALLSTQINYDPKLLTLIKQSDRQNLYIANSIGHKNDRLVATNLLFDIDLNFSQIGYSCVIGLDYFSSIINKTDRIFTENINNQQVSYNIEILKADKNEFVKVD